MNNNEQEYRGVDRRRVQRINRRRFPRVNARVQYEIIDKEYSKIALNTKNISAGGIAFFAKDKIEINSLLSLSINLPDATNFQAKAQVVWYDSAQVSWNPGIRFEWGVKFIEIDEKNRQKISKFALLRLNRN